MEKVYILHFFLDPCLTLIYFLQEISVTPLVKFFSSSFERGQFIWFCSFTNSWDLDNLSLGVKVFFYIFVIKERVSV